jgi:xylulokinase
VADVLQTRLICPTAEEGAAYGAALIAMIGIGLYSDFEALIQVLPQSNATLQSSSLYRVNEPASQPVYDRMFDRYQAWYYALKTAR